MLSMLFQVWVRGRRKNTRSLAGPGSGFGRRAREWFAKIRIQPLREMGFLLQICILLRL
jgi:hypothetical protein